MAEDKQNYVPYRVAKKSEFCLDAALKIQRMKEEMRKKHKETQHELAVHKR